MGAAHVRGWQGCSCPVMPHAFGRRPPFRLGSRRPPTHLGGHRSSERRLAFDTCWWPLAAQPANAFGRLSDCLICFGSGPRRRPRTARGQHASKASSASPSPTGHHLTLDVFGRPPPAATRQHRICFGSQPGASPLPRRRPWAHVPRGGSLIVNH